MNKRAILMALVAAAFFGAATPVSKSFLDVLSPLMLAGLLYLGAALGVQPLLWRTKRRLLPWEYPARSRWLLAGAIVFGGILGPLFLLLGLQRASAGSVSIWLNLEAVATALLGYFLFRDQLDGWGWLGAAIMIFASVLLTWSEGLAGLQAGTFVLLACICWGLDNHFTALIDGITPAESTFWKGLVAGTFNVTLALVLMQGAGSWQIVAGALTLGIFAYGLSIVLYITSAQQAGATRSQLIFSTAPFWGVLLSVLFLNEALTPVMIVSGLLAIVSILLLSLERHVHVHRHEPMTHEHWHSHDDFHHDHLHEGGRAPRFHSHAHTHDGRQHSHPHLPDLHHRHIHDELRA